MTAFVSDKPATGKRVAYYSRWQTAMPARGRLGGHSPVPSLASDAAGDQTLSRKPVSSQVLECFNAILCANNPGWHRPILSTWVYWTEVLVQPHLPGPPPQWHPRAHPPLSRRENIEHLDGIVHEKQGCL